jgi:predicted nucleic acid-binding protein
VIGEIKGGAENGHGESAKLVELIDSGKLDVVELDNEALESFISIVSGSTSDSLGDGEAATLAFAHRNGLVAAIDEKKARRVAGESFGSLTIATTVDILAYAPVGLVLGKERLSKTVLDALRLARMQVWEPHFDWVVAQIGPANVPLCPSLRRLAKRVRVTTAQ